MTNIDSLTKKLKTDVKEHGNVEEIENKLERSKKKSSRVRTGEEGFE